MNRSMWQKGHSHRLALLFARYVYICRSKNCSLCINFPYIYIFERENVLATTTTHVYKSMCLYTVRPFFLIISHRLIDMNTHSVWLTFEMFSHPPLFPFTTNQRFLCTWFLFLLLLLLLFLRLLFFFFNFVY